MCQPDSAQIPFSILPTYQGLNKEISQRSQHDLEEMVTGSSNSNSFNNLASSTQSKQPEKLQVSVVNLLTWFTIGMAISVAVGGVVGLVIQSQPTPQILPISGSTEQASPPLETSGLTEQVQLEQARQLATQGNFKAAIDNAIGVPSTSLYYQSAMELVDRWSNNLMQIAQEYHQQRKLDEALKALMAIPSNRPAYSQAVQLAHQLQTEKNEQTDNQRHYQFAKQALSSGNWFAAMQEINQVTNHPDWQQAKADLFQQAEEYENRGVLERSYELLEKGELQNAIAEVQKLPDETPWRERKEQVIRAAEDMKYDQSAEQKRKDFCRDFSGGFFSQCPVMSDLGGLIARSSSNRRFPH